MINNFQREQPTRTTPRTPPVRKRPYRRAAATRSRSPFGDSGRKPRIFPLAAQGVKGGGVDPPEPAAPLCILHQKAVEL